jgi:hypothetical protein
MDDQGTDYCTKSWNLIGHVKWVETLPKVLDSQGYVIPEG